jgi:hypothetical protein
MATSAGGIKRTPLSAFSSIQRNGLAAIKLLEVHTCAVEPEPDPCSMHRCSVGCSCSRLVVIQLLTHGASCFQPSGSRRCAHVVSRCLQYQPLAASLCCTAVRCRRQPRCVWHPVGCSQICCLTDTQFPVYGLSSTKLLHLSYNLDV